MKLSIIHNLIKNHIYFANVPEKEILGIYESCYHTLLSNRTTIVDLLSTGFIELINNWEFDEKLGLQAIDAKLQEKYPLLTADDRLLLYRMAQDRVSQFYVTGYELNTLRGNLYKKNIFKSVLSLATKLLPIIRKENTYSSLLNLQLSVINYIKKNTEYVSNLNLNIYSMIRMSTKTYFKSDLNLSVRLISTQKTITNYVNKLSLSLKLIRQNVYEYKNQLSLNCRVVSLYDHVTESSYKSSLSLSISLE